MSRTRLIRPESAIDPTLAVLDSDTRLLAAYLPCLADKAGVLKDQPLGIRFQIFPAQPTADVDAMLDTLAAAGALIRYEGTDTSGKAAGPQRLVYLTRFDQDQRPHHSEAASTFTRPSAQGASCGAGSDTQGELPNQPRLVIAPTKIGVVTPHSDSCSDACSDTKGEGVASSECAGAPDQGNQEPPPVELNAAQKPEPAPPARPAPAANPAARKPAPQSTPASTKQMAWARTMLNDHGLTQQEWMRRQGRQPDDALTDADVTAIKAAYGRPPMAAAATPMRPYEVPQFYDRPLTDREDSKRTLAELEERGQKPGQPPAYSDIELQALAAQARAQLQLDPTADLLPWIDHTATDKRRRRQLKDAVAEMLSHNAGVPF